jgi:hypothetical protein
MISDEAALFEIEMPPPVSLADRFVVPPFSILDRRSGLWQDRRRKWLSMGIESELGREEHMGFLAAAMTGKGGVLEERIKRCGGAVSIFDPVLCELAYRWFSPEGGRVLDPFAGGSVRGVVASTLLRDYLGVDLREAQVVANNAQAGLGTPTLPPAWVCGDSSQVLRPDGELGPDYEADFVFSCPPYADLEVYSDDPADLSNMSADDFTKAYYEIIRLASARLKQDRFAAWVISDVRDKHGLYRGLVLNTIDAFNAAGLALYNDLITIDPVGSGALLAAGQFNASRKVRRMHQHMLVFVKGDPKRAAVACGATGKKRKGKPPEPDAVVQPPPLTPEDKAALEDYLAEVDTW